MSEQNFQSLLSAYFDNETTDEERLQAESLLEESSAARSELADIRQLSALLQDQTREQLPVSFSESVLAEISSASSIRPARSGWGAVIVSGFVTLATCLLVGLGLGLFDDSSEEFGKVASNQEHSADVAEKVAEVETAKSAGREKAPGRKTPLDLNVSEMKGEENAEPDHHSGGTKFAPETVIVPQNSQPKRAGFDNPAGEPAALPVPPNLTETAPLKQKMNLRYRPPGTRSQPKEIRVGQVLSMLQDNGDQVRVIEVMVLDVNKGLDALELLLTRHRIAESDDSIKTNKDRVLRTKKLRENKAPGEVFAVYVQARPDHISNLLNEIAQEPNVSELVVDRGLPLRDVRKVASLDKEMLPKTFEKRLEAYEQRERGSSSEETKPRESIVKADTESYQQMLRLSGKNLKRYSQTSDEPENQPTQAPTSPKKNNNRAVVKVLFVLQEQRPLAP